MIVLGFDTATSATAVALLAGDGTVRELRDDPAQGAHPGHATRLLGLADELLAAAGLRWPQVERIAVGLGPGAFTGLRVGIATARGLAQGLDAELVGVSSLAALADGVLAEAAPADRAPADRGPAGRMPSGGVAPGRVLAVIDARRGEVFAAPFERGRSGLPAALAPPRALAPGAVAGVLADVTVAVGDGAVRYRAELEAAGATVPPDYAPEHLIRAAAVCAAGAAGAPASHRHAVVPDYVRRPDAELALEGTG